MERGTTGPGIMKHLPHAGMLAETGQEKGHRVQKIFDMNISPSAAIGHQKILKCEISHTHHACSLLFLNPTKNL